MKRRVVVAFALLLLPAFAFAQNGLRVVSAGPVGQVSSLAEANEIRVVFSEPMVVLGRIPSPVMAPFFRIEPKVKGTFRWSGTTTLLFTPDHVNLSPRQFSAPICAKSSPRCSMKAASNCVFWSWRSQKARR